MTGSLILDLLLFVYAGFLPGVALAWIALDDAKPDPVVLLSVGATLALFALPMLDFVLAVMLRTHIRPALLLGVGTVILAGCGAVHMMRKRRRAREV